MVSEGLIDLPPVFSLRITAVRSKVEENQLVGVFGEIGVRVDGLKSA